MSNWSFKENIQQFHADLIQCSKDVRHYWDEHLIDGADKKQFLAGIGMKVASYAAVGMLATCIGHAVTEKNETMADFARHAVAATFALAGTKMAVDLVTDMVNDR